MVEIYYAELITAVIRLLLILIGILICVELITKTSGKFKMASMFFLISFIPSAFYTVGRILNIESVSNEGKFMGLTFNFLTTSSILLGLFMLNKLVIEISSSEEEIIETEKNKGIDRFRKTEKITSKIQAEKPKIKKIKEKTNYFNSILGKTITTKKGKELGIVRDITFETDSGELINIIIKNPTSHAKELNLEEIKSELLIPYNAVDAIGDFVIISEDLI